MLSAVLAIDVRAPDLKNYEPFASDRQPNRIIAIYIKSLKSS